MSNTADVVGAAVLATAGGRPTARRPGATHDHHRHPATDDTAGRAATTQTHRMTSAPGSGPDGGTAQGFGLHHAQLAVPAGSEDACRTF